MRRLVIGQEVFHNERITIDTQGQTQILFLDGSSVSVSPNADLAIDEFIYGLGHYEGRGWRGFHHHATLCIAAYGFLIAQRASIPPSGPGPATTLQKPALPDGYRPRGAADPAGTAHPKLDRHPQTAPHRRPRQHTRSMSVLPCTTISIEPTPLMT